MSRALNPKVIAVLKTGNHQEVFDNIADVLTYDATCPARLEIEILSGFGFDTSRNYLRNDNAVAIPKLRLVQAFFVARTFLQQHGGIMEENKREGEETEEVAGRRRSAIRKATAVCLMMDAENLTASNTRKRLLVAEIKDAERPDGVAELLRAEKWFLDSILTSWLHRHTKSPTLWSHRRWLLGQFQSHGLADEEIVVADEIASVIGAAGERHPRNYYAWNHARGIVTGFLYNEPDVVAVSKKWAWKHHCDVSGWSFLLFVLQRHSINEDGDDIAGSIIAETEALAESLQWRNESVWWFLRTLVGARAKTQERQALMDLGKKLFEDGKRENSEEEENVWQRSKTWTLRWEESLE